VRIGHTRRRATLAAAAHHPHGGHCDDHGAVSKG